MKYYVAQCWIVYNENSPYTKDGEIIQLVRANSKEEAIDKLYVKFSNPIQIGNKLISDFGILFVDEEI